MLLHIPGVIDAKTLSEITQGLDGATWQDGKATATGGARAAKNNQQLPRSSELARELGAKVLQAITRNEVFRLAALPRSIVPPLFGRYEAGMEYGPHLDLPVMGGASGQIRTDIATTVFLDAPTAYDGGELVFGSDYGEKVVKGEAGDLVLYPASTIHRVAEVERGVRRVAVTWVQSNVRDPARRQLLFDLAAAAASLEQRHPDEDASALVRKSHYNLMRMWVDN